MQQTKKYLLSGCALAIALAFMYTSVVAQAKSKTSRLRAAAVKVDISPDSPKQLLGYGARLSTGVHDKIYHRIVVMDDGATQFVLVSTDVCLVSPSEYDHTAELLNR